MESRENFEVIIIGGSYSGLSAAMALGRSLRKVLIIDGGEPCNRQTPRSHNFLTEDGKTPQEISALAWEQVKKYKTVVSLNDIAITGVKTEKDFKIKTQNGNTFSAKRLIFASGLHDKFPEIGGFSECWGKSILHCPYCHGYEVKNERTGILANGETAFHYAHLLSNLTKELFLFTNGKSTLTAEQSALLAKNNIEINEHEIDFLEHKNGQVNQINFTNGRSFKVSAIYSKPDFEQKCRIPETLGCELTEKGLLKTDNYQQTSIKGVYACGDNSGFRSLSVAVSTGSLAGVFLNNSLTEEEFIF